MMTPTLPVRAIASLRVRFRHILTSVQEGTEDVVRDANVFEAGDDTNTVAQTGAEAYKPQDLMEVDTN